MKIKGNTYYFTTPEKVKIKKLLDKKYGKFSTPVDYESTSDDFDFGIEAEIKRFTGKWISGSTLERLVGLTGKPESGFRLITIEVVVNYLGFKNIEQFRKKIEYSVLNPDLSLETFSTEAIFSTHNVNIQFTRNKSISVRYLGKNMFEILDSKNSIFIKGDNLEISVLELKNELSCNSVTRSINGIATPMGRYSSGENNIVTRISFSK